MYIKKIKLINFRNYKGLERDVDKRGLFIKGSNGTGKTNLIEALHVLLTGRSQRGCQRNNLICFDKKEAFLSAALYRESKKVQEIRSIGFSRDRRLVMKINSSRVNTLSEWFNNTSVIYFTPEDIDIIYGNTHIRRGFADYIISQTDYRYLSNLIEYKSLLNHRNALLNMNHTGFELSVYNRKLSDKGAYLILKRRDFKERINKGLKKRFVLLSGFEKEPFFEYTPSVGSGVFTEEELSERMYETLEANTENDSIKGFTTKGVHRDKYSFNIDGRDAKSFSSRGQCRSLATAFKLCSLDYIQGFGDEGPVILFDDASSELDRTRSASIFSYLKERGQVFITDKDDSNKYDLPEFCIEDYKGQ